MAQIPEKVLAWLYSVLHEYQDPQRVYSDTARLLSVYPTVSPRTEVYTYENGTSALLLTLSGTLPVSFRGTLYRFPVKIWLPQSYPQQPPMAFVDPGKDLIVRPAQHVGVDGRLYHPYLRDWSGMWDRASMTELVELLQQVFAKEPPVISKTQQQQYQRSIGQQAQHSSVASSAFPQIPPKQRFDNMGSVAVSSTNAPPPRPPKPGDDHAGSLPPRTSSRNTVKTGPPLPPLPDGRFESRHFVASPQLQNGYAAPPRPSGIVVPQQRQGYQDDRPTGLSLPSIPLRQQQQQQQQQQQYQQGRTGYDRSPVSPVSPMNEFPQPTHAQPLAVPRPYQRPYPYQQKPPQAAGYLAQPQHSHYRPSYQHQNNPLPRQFPPDQHYPAQNVPPQPAPATKAPLPDLLSDPFDVALPGPAHSGAPASAPPIPPNPEKEHLLHALTISLVQQAEFKVSQNMSAIAPLQAQQHALHAAHSRLETEIRQLEALHNTLESNEAILRRSIQDCDTTISTAKSKKQPPIDEVLLAPTMVANQLWTLCAEEAACREAMYVLQKAVDRGRVSGNDFVRQMRGLGRECFLKMVLARKCARGMGLEVGVR